MLYGGKLSTFFIRQDVGNIVARFRKDCLPNNTLERIWSIFLHIKKRSDAIGDFYRRVGIP
jgi:hypothetical protein